MNRRPDPSSIIDVGSGVSTISKLAISLLPPLPVETKISTPMVLLRSPADGVYDSRSFTQVPAAGDPRLTDDPVPVPCTPPAKKKASIVPPPVVSGATGVTFAWHPGAGLVLQKGIVSGVPTH